MSDGSDLILVVDDDPGLVKMVKRSLEFDGYEVITAGDGATALQLIEDRQPSLVLLDIMMPGLDGYQVCQRVRQTADVPIVMLTAKSRLQDVVQGLDIGADDYITKPFGTDELLARVKKVLRRSRLRDEGHRPFVCHGLTIDFVNHEVTVDGQQIPFTPPEYRALCLLALNAGEVVTDYQILQVALEQEDEGRISSVRGVIASLRAKIGDNERNPRYIITTAGGHMFRSPT